MQNIDWKWLLFSPKGRVHRKLFYIGFLINFIIGSVISLFGAYILGLFVDIKNKVAVKFDNIGKKVEYIKCK